MRVPSEIFVARLSRGSIETDLAAALFGQWSEAVALLWMPKTLFGIKFLAPIHSECAVNFISFDESSPKRREAFVFAIH